MSNEKTIKRKISPYTVVTRLLSYESPFNLWYGFEQLALHIAATRRDAMWYTLIQITNLYTKSSNDESVCVCYHAFCNDSKFKVFSLFLSSSLKIRNNILYLIWGNFGSVCEAAPSLLSSAKRWILILDQEFSIGDQGSLRVLIYITEPYFLHWKLFTVVQWYKFKDHQLATNIKDLYFRGCCSK